MVTEVIRIACLHTAQSNIAVFEAARLGLGEVLLTHAVRADLLASAEAVGGLSAAIAAETRVVLADLARDADVVLLTCSTLGPSVDSEISSVPILRGDAALARAAVSVGGKVVVLCAAPTTLGPTRDLYLALATGSEAKIDIRLVRGAWERFKAGDHSAYQALIAAAADQASREGADCVALAQASMAPAAALTCERPPPLTSPRAGLVAALVAAQAGSLTGGAV